MRAKEPAFYKLPITAWPESDRPREKLMQSGPLKLTETELLAILLRSGAGGKSAVDIAREMLQKSGGLNALAQMDYHDILDLKIRGLGPTKAVTVAAGLQLGRRLQADSVAPPQMIIHNSDEVAKIYMPRLRDLRKEIFMVVLLASNNKIIRDKVISEGVLNASVVTPREVFREAILGLAAAVILIHNHPSGNPEPSSEDLQLTRQMKESGQTMNIPVLDHIIIAADRYTSFADKKLL
ncbi:MAG: DNA repair protein RadC [Candidatus Marinimicrobia bacterium]|nr:DNA repair protein RadC [Candidatus Neomarinimicrobiota bacterium]MDD5061939.1 DNA repair protein RadC [Candidatus Neomarinimicrobiota bacterium]